MILGPTNLGLDSETKAICAGLHRATPEQPFGPSASARLLGALAGKSRASFVGRRLPRVPIHDALAIFQQPLTMFYTHFTLCQQGSSDSACMVLIMSLVETTELKVRRKPRRQVLDTGLIRFGEFSACCVLRNFSEIGAALDVGPGNCIPDKFTLIVVREKKIYSCEVIWRRGKRIGVSFC